MAEDGEKPKPQKGALFYAGLSAFIGGLFLLISFASPYWLQSYQIAYLDFKNMGLWEFCFQNFRYPFNQFDHKFNGCHYVFSDEYRILREWILPAWLQVVQAFVSLAFLTSFCGQITVTLLLVRWPLALWRRFRYEMTLTALALTALTVLGLFMGVAVFGGKCWDREWLMYPNYNYVSWSFYFAIIALGLHVVASLLLALEVYVLNQNQAQSDNILMHMQPAESHHGSAYI